MTIRIAVGAAMCLTLAACDLGTVVATEKHTAVITGINPPKHFRITVRDDTGRVMTISVSKHCNSWRSHTRIGMTVPLYYERLVYKDGRRGVRVTNHGLRQLLCGGW